VPAIPSALAEALQDRYSLERELGRGGMATVYLAHDLKHDRPVALKVLHPELAAALGPERFLREIRTTAQLQHPHILPVHESGEAAGQLWYTMPYVEGESLRDRLNREKQLPLDDAVQIARNILAALAYAHGHGVIHRDIKPENVLLEGDEAVVADFGIARAISAAGTEHLTQTGMSVGTPAYMSPEQAAGSAELDGRSDLYSLGCVLYEMLAGEPPYTGPTPQAVIAKRFLEPVPHLRTVRESLPETLEQAVTKALARVPADRFATASQFAQALAVSAGATPTATPVATPSAPPRGLGIRRALGLGLALLLAAAGGLLVWRWLHGGPRSAGPKMLAVLPFENLGQAEDEYFADGLTEEITSRLASVSGLGIISRTSANQYKKTTKTLKQIGHELGAGYVLEGSVRWDKPQEGKGRVRVTPQLIEVADDRHLWADRYDAELADVFEVQASIAERVTSALDVALRPGEQRGLTVKPTANLTAYDYYLRGNEYYERGHDRLDLDAFRTAISLYDSAVRLDPRFAAGYVRRSQARAGLYWWGDRADSDLVGAQTSADTAVRLAPDLAGVHVALGYCYYWGHYDYPRALEEFGYARRLQPNNSEVVFAIGALERRQGRWAEALADQRQAVALSPRSADLKWDLAYTYALLRRYSEADRYLDQAIALTPDSPLLYGLKASWHVLATGDVEGARQILRGALGRASPEDLVVSVPPFLVAHDSAFQSAIVRVSPAAFRGSTAWYLGWKADLYREQGRQSLARAYFDSLRALRERDATARPDKPSVHLDLGRAYAGLDRKTDAIREARRACELLPISTDAFDGGACLVDLARVYSRVSEQEAAIDQLAMLLKIPAEISTAGLRSEPTWAPLRSNPRFQRLIGEQH